MREGSVPAGRRVVGVMGSGKEKHEELVAPLGRWLAERGYDLLTGAGTDGVMAAVCEAFSSIEERSGISIGIVRAKKERIWPPRTPNRWIDLPIYTHLPLSDASRDSRNHINILTSNVVVAFPGGTGTKSEIELAVRYKPERTILVGQHPAAPQGVIQAGGDLERVKEFITRWLPV